MREVTAASIRDNEVTAASISGAGRKSHAKKAEDLLELASWYCAERDRMSHKRGRFARRAERRWMDNAMYALAVAQVEATLAAVEA